MLKKLLIFICSLSLPFIVTSCNDESIFYLVITENKIRDRFNYELLEVSMSDEIRRSREIRHLSFAANRDVEYRITSVLNSFENWADYYVNSNFIHGDYRVNVWISESNKDNYDFRITVRIVDPATT